MAAPTPTARGTPAGIKLKDGYSSKLTFAANATLSIWEKMPKPAGMDGGDPIDQTTMHNVAWRTAAARSLKTLTPFTCKFAYDPNCYSQLNSLINVETTVTQSFGDGSTVCYFGFLQKVEFDELQEGKQPEGTATICPTNFDPVGKVEAGPVIVSVAGT